MVALSDIIIQVKDANKTVTSGSEKIQILKNINLSIYAQETVAITGESGSGKTTLLTLLAGLATPSSGEIFMASNPLHAMDEDARTILRGKMVGFIFQSFYLLPALTVLENVMLPLEIKGFTDYECRQRAVDWLSQVGLKNKIQHSPLKLSGGEQQRVAIARAFVAEPKIIFADEMTGNLDLKTGKMVMDLLFSLNEIHSTTIILVTHDLKFAARCQKQYSIVQGELA